MEHDLVWDDQYAKSGVAVTKCQMLDADSQNMRNLARPDKCKKGS